MNFKVGDKVALKPEYSTIKEIGTFAYMGGGLYMDKRFLDIVESAPCEHEYVCSKCGESLPEEKPCTRPAPEPIVQMYCFKDYKPGSCVTKGRTYCLDSEGCFHLDGGPSASNFVPFESLKQIYQSTCACLALMVKRPAQAGEWILVTESDGLSLNKYKNGDILRVSKRGSCDYGVSTSEGALYDKEYVVLEGYEPEPEKLYNGKVVCVEYPNACGLDYLTVGRVYKVVNGKLKGNLCVPNNYCCGIKDFEMLNRYCAPHAKFIELVE